MPTTNEIHTNQKGMLMSIPQCHNALSWKFQTHSVNDSMMNDFDWVFLEIPVGNYIVGMLLTCPISFWHAVTCGLPGCDVLCYMRSMFSRCTGLQGGCGACVTVLRRYIERHSCPSTHFSSCHLISRVEQPHTYYNQKSTFAIIKTKNSGAGFNNELQW